MSGAIDLGAYCARIGYSGPRTPTLAVLADLHRLHPQAIAFEALNAFFHLETVGLDAASLEAKLVHGKRGGWCFEQNTLFALALRQFGFTVANLAARFLYRLPPGTVSTRGHMCLHVVCEDRDMICDVGLGSLTQTGPLLLEPGLIQETPHERYRIQRAGDVYTPEAEVAGAWRPLFRFDLTPEPDEDNIIYNHYLSTHPRSLFRNHVMAARVTKDGRWTLNDKVLARYPSGAAPEKRTLASAEEMDQVLREIFLIEPPRSFAEAWARVPD